MKNSRRFILFLLISVSVAQAQLIQKKYPGIQGKSSELLFINNESAFKFYSFVYQNQALSYSLFDFLLKA